MGPRPNLPSPQPRHASPACRLPRRDKQLVGEHADAGGSCLPACRPPRRPYCAREMPLTYSLTFPSQRRAPVLPPRQIFVPQTLEERTAVNHHGHHGLELARPCPLNSPSTSPSSCRVDSSLTPPEETTTSKVHHRTRSSPSMNSPSSQPPRPRCLHH